MGKQKKRNVMFGKGAPVFLCNQENVTSVHTHLDLLLCCLYIPMCQCDSVCTHNISADRNANQFCQSFSGSFLWCSSDQHTCTALSKTALHLAHRASTVKRLSPAVVKLYDFPCCFCLQASDITEDDESSFRSVLSINTAHLSSLKRGKLCWRCIWV